MLKPIFSETFQIVPEALIACNKTRANNRVKVLLVDFDKKFLQVVKRGLKKSKILAENAMSFKEADLLLGKHRFDCLIFDDGIVNQPGLALLKNLKDNWRNEHIIIITEPTSLRFDEADFLADDIVLRSSYETGLIEKIKVASGKRLFDSHVNLQFGELVVDVKEQVVYVSDQLISFNKMEKNFFFMLITNKNKVVSNNALSRLLIKKHISDSQAIYQHMKNVRKKLTDAGFPDQIKTVNGVGYRFDWL